jgi:hypothetical protein
LIESQDEDYVDELSKDRQYESHDVNCQDALVYFEIEIDFAQARVKSVEGEE